MLADALPRRPSGAGLMVSVGFEGGVNRSCRFAVRSTVSQYGQFRFSVTITEIIRNCGSGNGTDFGCSIDASHAVTIGSGVVMTDMPVG
jgi:hypothetical protein